jgi:hypothetical protein
VFRVRDGQQALATELLEILEILSDFPERFELLVVDELATDHTEEVGYRLAREYPQVRYVRRRYAARELAVRDRAASGDLVFIQRGHAPVRPSHVRRMWQNRERQRAIQMPLPR